MTLYRFFAGISRKIFLIALTLSLFSLRLFSQQQSKKLIIHFESDSYTLSAEAKKSIDSLLAANALAGVNCKIYITGFTDSTGSSEYNEALAMRRSNSTADYFRSKGFANTSCAGKAESNAIADNSTEQGKALNRRVEITFTRTPFQLNQLGKLRNEEQVTKLDAEKGGEIIEASGTKLTIPTNAFLHKNGKPVTGAVDISYTEYRDPVDFLLSGIPMTMQTKDGMAPFNSAGMFRLEAFQNGEQLSLAPGKPIDVQFAATQNLPDLNFYKFDSISGKWSQLGTLTDSSGRMTGAHGTYVARPICGYSGGSNYCSMDACDAKYYLATAGPRYASGTADLAAEARRSDSLRRLSEGLSASIGYMRSQLVTNKVHSDSISAQEKRMKRYYRVRKISVAKGKTIFEIKCLQPASNELVTLKKYTWEYSSEDMTSLNDSIFKKKWDECRITHLSDGKFSIELKDNSGRKPVSIDHVKMVFPGKVKKRNRTAKENAAFAAYDSAYSVYAESLADLLHKQDSIARDNIVLKKQIDSLSAVLVAVPSNSFSYDSLYCFYSESRQYMTAEEMKLNFYSWLNYFNLNKPLMYERYTALKNAPGYSECEKVAKQRAQVAAAAAIAAANEQKLQYKSTAVFQNLSVSELGVYNCDQVARLQPLVVNVNASYKDQNNEPLTIIVVYIIDKSINSILKYDGFNNMSPLNFAYSAASPTTMIAFDDKLNVYTFTPEQFSAVDPKSGRISYTFQLKKMRSPETKKDLLPDM